MGVFLRILRNVQLDGMPTTEMPTGLGFAALGAVSLACIGYRVKGVGLRGLRFRVNSEGLSNYLNNGAVYP